MTLNDLIRELQRAVSEAPYCGERDIVRVNGVGAEVDADSYLDREIEDAFGCVVYRCACGQETSGIADYLRHVSRCRKAPRPA